MERKLMSDLETSEYTGLSLWAVNELRRRRQIPYIKFPGIRKYYYDQESIDRWIRENEQKSVKEENRLRMAK